MQNPILSNCQINTCAKSLMSPCLLMCNHNSHKHLLFTWTLFNMCKVQVNPVVLIDIMIESPRLSFKYRAYNTPTEKDVAYSILLV